MNLKTKILLGYGFSFAIMSFVVAWAVTNLLSLGKASDAILRENYRSILAADNMIEALSKQDKATLEILLGNPDSISRFREAEPQFNEETMYAAGMRAGRVAERATWSTVIVATSAFIIDQILLEKSKGEAILSSIEDGLVIFDVKLKVTGVNPAARRILNLEFTESAPLRCEDIFSDSGVCELIHSTIETGIPPTIPDEQRIISIPEGERTLHYLFSVTAVRGRDRNLTGIILLLRNVTRLKEVEQLKNEFVTAASHELRTPRPAWG